MPKALHPQQAVPSAPRRRGRPPSIDDEQLLAVAREVFLEQGIRATTQDVAQRAGVSEGSIFHRFKSKEELFRQSMKLDRSEVARLFEEAITAIHPLPVHEALEQLGLRMLEIGRIAIPLMMMSWSNPCCRVHDQDPSAPRPYRTLIRGVSGYLRARMAEGALRQLDPEIVARTFVGAVHHYSVVRTVIEDSAEAEGQMTEQQFVAGLVDLLLRGCVDAPPGESPSEL